MTKTEAAVVVGILLVLLGVGWLTVTVWQECRVEGHSFFYCLKLVSR